MKVKCIFIIIQLFMIMMPFRGYAGDSNEPNHLREYDKSIDPSIHVSGKSIEELRAEVLALLENSKVPESSKNTYRAILPYLPKERILKMLANLTKEKILITRINESENNKSKSDK